jgi:hypothetical protein
LRLGSKNNFTFDRVTDVARALQPAASAFVPTLFPLPQERRVETRRSRLKSLRHTAAEVPPSAEILADGPDDGIGTCK